MPRIEQQAVNSESLSSRSDGLSSIVNQAYGPESMNAKAEPTINLAPGSCAELHGLEICAGKEAQAEGADEIQSQATDLQQGLNPSVKSNDQGGMSKSVEDLY